MQPFYVSITTISDHFIQWLKC